MLRRDRLFQVYATTLSVVGLIAIAVLSFLNADGHLIYSLDDPYIHLSVAESILEGGYGINSGEYASPSSSIIYPFLLAFGLSMGLGDAAPFIIAGVFAVLSVWVAGGFVGRTYRLDGTPLGLLAFLVMGLALVLCLNAIGLAMTGMEHSLHVFGSVLALTGLYDLARKGDRGKLPAIIFGTLICAVVRFEGLALAGVVLLALVALKEWRVAVAVAAIIGAVLLAYLLYMSSLGLPLLPSSVMVKSNVAAQANDGNLTRFLSGLWINFYVSLLQIPGLVLALSAAIIGAMMLDETYDLRIKVFCLSVALVITAHVLAGRYGWFSRYEIYAVASMVIGLVALFQIEKITQARFRLALAAVLLGFAFPYLRTTMDTPEASANIYQQQYQMHRFVQQYFPERVAVNDLGWVAYKNSNYVLDLWGLGSEEARKMRAEGQWNSASLADITQRNNVAFAMVYDSWFEDLPPSWCHAASLVTSQVTSASDTVAFYLVDPAKGAAFQHALQAFSESLPNGARLDRHACPPSSQ